jgi:hypothetical protein
MNITTPQRPQQKRRQRHTTLNGDNTTTPKMHSAQSSSNLRPQPQTQSQRRTPQSQPRSNQFFNNSNKLQRQHSVSCCTPTGKLTPPRLIRLQKATNGGSQTSLFAGSKFMDSPAPESIPMPPLDWFSVDLNLNRRGGSSPTPSSVSDSLSSASASSFEDSKSLASSGDELLSIGYGSPGGFRLNPLQLIAAVSAVA